jgi:ferric-dicitrate binding protein FerR (iron transport regulator)
MMSKKDLDKKLLSYIEREKTFLDDLMKVDVDKNWARFQHSLSQETKQAPGYSIIQSNRLLLSRIAAAILILIASATTIYLAKQKSVHHIQQVNSLLKNTEVQLSDGSIILLNKGTILSYPEKLNPKKREVSLSGEAFFEVAQNSAAPFHVYISNTTVKVIGTSFNIKEEEEGNKIIVSVMSGEVAFYESSNENNVIRLETGQQGIFDSRTGSFGHGALKSDNFLYWKTNNLSFKYETLSLVFEELEKCFHTSIVVEDSTILQNRLTTTCEGQQLIPILDELAILFDLKYSIKGDSVFMQSKHQ